MAIYHSIPGELKAVNRADKRFDAAARAMQGMIAHNGGYVDTAGMASRAVMHADALLAELDKTQAAIESAKTTEP